MRQDKTNTNFESTMGISISGIIEKAIGAIIAGLALTYGFKIRDPNLSSYLENLSITDTILIIGIIILAIILIIVVIKRRSRWNWISVGLPPMIAVDYQDIGVMHYEDVRWIIEAPRIGPVNADHIRVKIPPRCPKCGTELEETKSRFKGVVWNCVRNDFKKHKGDNFQKIANRLLKDAKRSWEEGKFSFNNKQ